MCAAARCAGVWRAREAVEQAINCYTSRSIIVANQLLRLKMIYLQKAYLQLLHEITKHVKITEKAVLLTSEKISF